MGNTKSRAGVLIGLAAVAGAFGATMAIAPTAHADPVTDIVNAVDGDFTNGQTAFSAAFADFSSNQLVGGLAALYDGINDDSLSAPDNFLIGTVDALSNESVSGPIAWGFAVPTSFSDALTLASDDFAAGETELTDAATALAGGDFGAGTYDFLVGLDIVTTAPLYELLMGAATSF